MRYHTGGFKRFWVRGIFRVRTWLKRNEFIEREDFCYKHPSRMDDEQESILYVSALEFVRFLESEQSIDTLNLIIDDVGTGSTFDESVQIRLGETCEELYRRWKDSF